MMVAIVGQYISQTDSTCQAQNNGINKLYFYKRRAIHMPPAFGARKLFIQKGLFDRKVRQLRRCSKLPLAAPAPLPVHRRSVGDRALAIASDTSHSGRWRCRSVARWFYGRSPVGIAVASIEGHPSPAATPPRQ